MAVLLSDSSCFADVYDLNDGRVLKAFRRKFNNENQSDFDLLVKGYFWKEVEGYIVVSESDFSKYIPEFHGVCDPHEILQHIPDYEQKYVSNCGFIIDKLIGTENKLRVFATNETLSHECVNELDRMSDEISILLRGLDVDVSDCSCFVGEDESFKFIDFSAWDASPYEEQLAESCSIENDARNILENYITKQSTRC